MSPQDDRETLARMLTTLSLDEAVETLALVVDLLRDVMRRDRVPRSPPDPQAAPQAPHEFARLALEQLGVSVPDLAAERRAAAVAALLQLWGDRPTSAEAYVTTRHGSTENAAAIGCAEYRLLGERSHDIERTGEATWAWSLTPQGRAIVESSRARRGAA